MALNTLECAQLHSTTSDQVLLNLDEPKILKCAQLHLTTSNHVLFNSNNHQYTQICTNTNNQLKSPLKCIKFVFKHYKHSNEHLQPPNMHLYTYTVPISKPSSTNSCSKCTPMHIQHEAPQKFLQALKHFKIHSLTN